MKINMNFVDKIYKVFINIYTDKLTRPNTQTPTLIDTGCTGRVRRQVFPPSSPSFLLPTTLMSIIIKVRMRMG